MTPVTLFVFAFHDQSYDFVILSEAKNLDLMRTPRVYCVYILASKSRVLYTGVTNNIVARVYQYKQKTVPGFTQRYNVDRLVYVEMYQDVREAISREKQIKGWLRAKKIELIESLNPAWKDLSEEL